MSLRTVTEHLRRHGKDTDILVFDDSSATVALAAEKVGTTPERIAKTLAFYDPQDAGRAVLIVAAGDARLHNGSFKRLFGGKPKMVSADDLERLTGHPMGGVCPFGNPEGARVYLDESLQRFDVVYPAAGTDRSAVRVLVAELEAISGAAGWVGVTTGWQEEDEDSLTP